MLNRIIRNWINKKLKTFEDGSLRLSVPGCSDIIIGNTIQRASILPLHQLEESI